MKSPESQAWSPCAILYLVNKQLSGCLRIQISLPDCVAISCSLNIGSWCTWTNKTPVRYHSQLRSTHSMISPEEFIHGYSAINQTPHRQLCPAFYTDLMKLGSFYFMDGCGYLFRGSDSLQGGGDHFDLYSWQLPRESVIRS